MGGGRAGEVRPVRLPPAARYHLFLRRRRVDGVMQPAVPGRRHSRGFDDAGVDHPAPLAAHHRTDLAALHEIITDDAQVNTQILTVERRTNMSTEDQPQPTTAH